MKALFIFLLLIISANAQPKWGFLGDDEDLEETFNDFDHSVMVCVYEVTLEKVKPPFALVVHKATVIKPYKGSLKVGEKIEIIFSTDSLPAEEEERKKFIADAHSKLQGSLKIAFVESSKSKRFFTEFLYVTKYREQLDQFLTTLAAKK